MLQQAQADRLRALPKQMQAAALIVPTPRNRKTWPAVATDGTASFLVDMAQGGIAGSSLKCQERYLLTEILVRLDVYGPPHRNPDHATVPTPRVHLYREGYNDAWAYPLPVGLDVSSRDLRQILHNFLAYCGFATIPAIT